MKHVDAEEKEILLANSDGKVNAPCDRCSHMNAPLSMGTLNGKVVTCAMHGARFDVTNGKKVGEPMALDPSMFPEPIPESLQKMFAHSAQIQSKIRTYDQPTYETKVEGNRVKVRL
jgi:nitrite reductase/ring-hydroxylating ferredoxin subunit